MPPLAHEDLKLSKCVYSLIACQVDHAGAAGAHGLDLGTVVLDMAIPRDDQPPLARSLGIHISSPVSTSVIVHGARTRPPFTRPPG